jgi:hypothetical protein
VSYVAYAAVDLATAGYWRPTPSIIMICVLHATECSLCLFFLTFDES